MSIIIRCCLILRYLSMFEIITFMGGIFIGVIFSQYVYLIMYNMSVCIQAGW